MFPERTRTAPLQRSLTAFCFCLTVILLTPLQPLAGTALLAQGVPTPAEIIGFDPGDDYKLADMDQLYAFYHALAEASPRVMLREIGTTFRGRPLLLLYISSEENLQQVDRLREISARLAQARGVDDAEARRLAKEGKVVVWIDSGLHSTEVAHSQHAPHLAYHMATDESDEVRRIRDDVVLLLMPLMNPDGHEVVVDWYRRNLGTEWETTSPPEVYHEFVGHDINRDWFMFRQAESQAVARVVYEEWFPQIVFNHHQTAPFPARIFIPPFSDPVNPHIPPLVVRGVNMVGEHMAKRMEERGMPGVVSRLTFTMWWNGGMRTAPYFHNMVGILSEVGHASATPACHDPDDLPEWIGSGSNRISAREPSVYYANPWQGGCVGLSDPVAYHFESSMGALDIASRLKTDWLYNIWLMGSRQIQEGASGGPFAYVVDVESQRDAGEAVELLNVLRRGGVEVHRATAPFQAGGRSYPAGSYVAYAGQAFRAHLMDLLEPHDHPHRELYPGGPPEPPYGGLSGWTISMAMGVDVHRVDEPFRVASEAVDRVPVTAGRVAPASGFGWVLTATRNDSRKGVNRLLSEGVRVLQTGEALPQLGELGAPGAFLIPREGGDTRARVDAVARELGLTFHAVDALPADAIALRAPRLGLYIPWTANMDEGWTRFVLREFGFPVDSLRNDDLQGDLSDYDVILFADQGASSIRDGHAPDARPPEFTGGVADQGVANLRSWVESGGTLVALDGAGDFVAEALGLPVTNRVAGVGQEDFFVPGSLIRTRVDSSNPIAFGMQDEAAAFFQGSRAWEVEPDALAQGRVEVVARYAEEDLLMSGWEVGAQSFLAGQPAVVRAHLGQGSAVLIGFRPQFRAQPTGTYKLFFNPIHQARMDIR
ncbi:MAG: M14 family zinc carboxypeptidase [Gemmatimonadota bacterium]